MMRVSELKVCDGYCFGRMPPHPDKRADGPKYLRRVDLMHSSQRLWIFFSKTLRIFASAKEVYI